MGRGDDWMAELDDVLYRLRREIDEIDSKIIELLRLRMKVCRDIGEYKMRAGLPVFDPIRHAEVSEKWGEFKEVFQVVSRLCREVEVGVQHI